MPEEKKSETTPGTAEKAEKEKKVEAPPQAAAKEKKEKKPAATTGTAEKVTKKKKKLSVLKRARQNEKIRIHNRAIKLKLQSTIKKLSLAVASGDKEKSVELLKKAFSALDKAAQKGIIHNNKAARKKASLSKKARALLSA